MRKCRLTPHCGRFSNRGRDLLHYTTGLENAALHLPLGGGSVLVPPRARLRVYSQVSDPPWGKGWWVNHLFTRRGLGRACDCFHCRGEGDEDLFCYVLFSQNKPWP